MKYLIGNKVKLERFENKHITTQYLGWINDSDITRYLILGRIPVVRNEMFVPDYNETIMFAIIALDSNAYVGTATLHNINWLDSKAEVGYMLGEKSFWGKGYATETVKLITDYAFDRLNLNKLHADVVESNVASTKVLNKNGFIHYATNPQDFYLEGEYLDNYLFYKLQK